MELGKAIARAHQDLPFWASLIGLFGANYIMGLKEMGRWYLCMHVKFEGEKDDLVQKHCLPSLRSPAHSIFMGETS